MPTRSLLAFVVVAALSCADSTDGPRRAPPPAAKDKDPSSSSSARDLQRPPHPNMASAAWGEHVAATLAKDLVVGAGDVGSLQMEALSALRSLDPGSEARARDLALRHWKAATTDAGRGLGLALAAVALVLDPTVDGYGERLTDAAGLSIYAGTVDSSDSVGQCARAVVGAAAGSLRQARELIKLVDETPAVPGSVADVRGWLAIARDSTFDGSDAFFADADQGLVQHPDNVRLRVLVVGHLLELGFVDDALKSLGTRTELPLVLLRGRAELARAQPAAAVALLAPLAQGLIGVDEPRRAEALFWLALAQLDVGAAPGSDLTSARASIAALEPRPGWKKETILLNAVLARREGRTDDAKKALLPLGTGTPTSTVVIERRIAAELLDMCAVATQDMPCVEKTVRHLALLDVDVARVALARAQVLTAAGTFKPEDHAVTTEAARLAPGDEALAGRLLAVRRALDARAPLLAAPHLKQLLKDRELRVARALRVQVARDPPETARFAAAAITGLGLPLAESDLVDVVAGLGAFKLKESESLLTLLDKDERPAVRSAVQLARNDLKDPDARKKRLAADRGEVTGTSEHNDDHQLPGGAVP